MGAIKERCIVCGKETGPLSVFCEVHQKMGMMRKFSLLRKWDKNKSKGWYEQMAMQNRKLKYSNKL